MYIPLEKGNPFGRVREGRRPERTLTEYRFHGKFQAIISGKIDESDGKKKAQNGRIFTSANFFIKLFVDDTFLCTRFSRLHQTIGYSTSNSKCMVK